MNNTLEYEIVELESVEDLGILDEYMFDIGMVDTPHTFFGNDILVHNSLFLSSTPFITSDLDKFTSSELIDKTISVAKQAQKFINDSYTKYVQLYHNCSTNTNLKIKQELVSKTLFMVAKKRYAQLVISEEGVILNEKNTPKQWQVWDNGEFKGKLDIKGLDIIRSDFPTKFKSFMTNIVNSILLKKSKKSIDDLILSFKDEMKQENIINIMSNSGINNLEEFDKERGYFKVNSGTPAHIESALYYNDLLKHFNLLDEEKLYSGRKIKWCYLIANPFNIDKIALKGYKDPQQIVEFVEKYFDYNEMFERKLKNKLQNFYDAMNWKELPTKENQIMKTFFNF